MTQGDLAQRAGVSQQQIAKLESGHANPSLETLDKIAAAIGMRTSVDLIDPARRGRGRN